MVNEPLVADARPSSAVRPGGLEDRGVAGGSRGSQSRCARRQSWIESRVPRAPNLGCAGGGRVNDSGQCRSDRSGVRSTRNQPHGSPGSTRLRGGWAMRTEALPGGEPLVEEGLVGRSVDLQDGPPATAAEIVQRRQVYRLVSTAQPTDADFMSVRAKNPDLRFRPASKECRARGLSAHISRASAEHYRKSTSKLAEYRICLVQLEPGAGYIQRNGEKEHCTWWPLADFKILPRCRVED